MRWRNALASALAAAALLVPGAASASASVQPAAPAVEGYYYEGILTPTDNPHWCVTMPFQHQEGARVFMLPCVKGGNTLQTSWIMWMVHGVGQVQTIGYNPNYNIGKKGMSNQARLFKETDAPSKTFYITFHFLHYEKGYQIYYLTPKKKALFLTVPVHMSAKSTKPYVPTWSPGISSAKANQEWNIKWIHVKHVPNRVAAQLAASTTAAANPPPRAWYFDGAVHPYGNPHWCFYGNPTERTAIILGEPVVLEKCKSVKGHPEAGEYWHGARLSAVGQMFLHANTNYVLGRHNRKEPVCFVSRDYRHGDNALIAFLQDKHGHWRISVTDQVNKKPYFLIMPEHLKASATSYPMKWREADLGPPKGWTEIVTGMDWKTLQTD